MSRHSVYESLKAYGFSPFKALEISFDWKRNKPYAIALVKIITG